MRAVADALGLKGAERARFDPWLTPPWQLRAWCRMCRRHRKIRRTSPTDRARLPRYAGHTGHICFDVLCLRHSGSVQGRRRRRLLQQKGVDRRVIEVLGSRRGRVIADAARFGDSDAIRERRHALAKAAERDWTDEKGVRKNRGRRQSEGHRAKRSYALWLHQTVKGPLSPLHACDGCGLAINRQRRHEYCDQAFRALQMRRQRSGQEVPSAPPRPPGFPDTREIEHLPRNYRWAMALGPDGKITRRELLGLDASYASDPSTVTKGINAFRQLAAGSWNLMFTDSNSRRRTNRYRHKALPLPEELQPFITEQGARDELILHLCLVLRMREDRVADLTGASVPYVRHVVESNPAASLGPEAPPLLPRGGAGRVAGRESERPPERRPSRPAGPRSALNGRGTFDQPSHEPR